MLNQFVAGVVMIYGIAILILGMIGYVHSGSTVSLMAGLGSGILLILCSLAIFSKNKLGAYIAVILSLFLTALFSYRYTITAKGLPAILALLSAGIFLFLMVRLAKWKKI